ncbi:MAG: AAA family ATPase [Actinomycetota bacterium]|nr:AAA family ATPase [Actinomycetota bacterium]
MADEDEEFAAEVTVRRRRFMNPDTGFAVLECEAEEEEVVLVGPVAHLDEEDRAFVVGAWEDDRRFGPQVKVREARPLAPAGDEAVVSYLCRVRHVGRRRATSLVERFGDGTLEAIDRDPAGAFAAAGMPARKADEAARSWDGLRTLRELHLLLAPHGLAYLAARVHKHYGGAAHRLIRERPYDLTAVFGVGFSVADRIARGTGVPADSPQRAAAAVLHCLVEAERSGNTCLPVGRLRADAAQLLGTEPPSEAQLAALAAAGDLALVQGDPDGGPWVYRAETERLEAELGELVLGLSASPPGERLRVPEKSVASAGIELAPEQWEGVRAAFASRLSVITGGPGTGKTATITTIGAVGRQQELNVVLVAPTGRAAKRMTEATGLPASTIHSALGWIPGQGALLDEDDPLAGDLLIVDEASMASLEVLVTLLRAVGPATHVVLVGDADQLAPVGAGKPFAELVESELVPTARLERIFRQAVGSMIVVGAHAVRRGNVPSFEAREGMQRDLFLIERSDPVAAREEIVDLVRGRLPAHYGVDPLTDVQVFTPVHGGELGTEMLNASLRAAINPDGEPACGGRLRIGDKLMITGRNLHELGLMNGTLLRLVAERRDPEDEDRVAGVVVAGEDQVFHLGAEDLDSLQLAYACSVHKGQGIELPVAVVVAHPAAGRWFFRREMLYTAMTRARLATVVVGTREAVARAARTADTERRYSRLGARLVTGEAV